MAQRYRQSVPRPPSVQPGTALSWSALPPAARVGIGLDRVRAAFRAGSPEVEALAALSAPSPEEKDAAGAAVLLALHEVEGEATALLIRRAAHLARDPGHVALPGGHVEPGEAPLLAALRETQEEIGLDLTTAEVIGVLPAVATPRSARPIQPFVALVRGGFDLEVNPDEVDAVLEVPLAALLVEGVAWEERWSVPEEHSVRFFAVPALGEDLVWGVTGTILWSLLELMSATDDQVFPNP
ncbi:MAG: hydrolase [Acidimicrobiaceae bacterium]|nr:hydrolase [Acidimicrobiaceae bacterium]